jgi:hypothetical protein
VPTNPSDSIWSVLLSPPVLLTIMACALLTGVIVWLVMAVQHRQREHLLSHQRQTQESTLERVLGAMADDKEKIVAEYEAQLRARDERIATLEREQGRLRDRLTSSGILGLFGGKQRDIVSALLLENEQLHELVAQKQGQLRDMMQEMSSKLVQRMDEQAQESAHAVRYKQALLSAFLQHSETQQLLDRLLTRGDVTSPGEDTSLGEHRSPSEHTSLKAPPPQLPEG